MSRKINDKELIRLADSNTPQKEIAALMGVSEAAISKRIKRLRQVLRPLALDNLSDKKKVFIREILKGNSRTDAALVAYNVTTINSAKSMGSSLMKDPSIQQAITVLMDEAGITTEKLLQTLNELVDSPDPSISLRAIDMALKLKNSYPIERKASININADLTDADVSRWFNGKQGTLQNKQ